MSPAPEDLETAVDADVSIMDDSVYIDGSEPDVAETLAEASAARGAAVVPPDDSVIGLSEVGATTGEDETVRDAEEKIDLREAEARRRNIYILLAIILVGLAIIGAVLGVMLSGGSSNSTADSAQGAVPPTLPEPTPFPIAIINPTPSPIVLPAVPFPVTPEPTPGAPITPNPTTDSPVTSSPVTPEPTTAAPITPEPTTAQPTTPEPTTEAPVFGPVSIPVPVETNPPTTIPPTFAPVTPAPTVTLAPIVPATPQPVPTTIVPSLTPSAVPSARPTTAIQAVIARVALQGGAEFADPESYQSQSLEWLEGNANIGSYTDQKLIQRYVCGCIHFATSGVFHRFIDLEETEWMISDGWLTDDDECTWYGLQCDLASASVITGINLRANNVTGSFPPEVTLLADSLVTFEIGNNNIWNKDEELSFLGELTNLRTLDIGITYFEYDGIPPAIGKLTDLEELDVAYTLLFGPIRGPEVFGNLQKLSKLEMGGNSYNQAIPDEIAKLPLLEKFYCDNALLFGNIDFIAEMPVIFEFWVDNNPGLTGTLPSALGDKFQSLQSLSLTNCGFIGTIPSEMGNLLQMQLLWLYGNDLTGTIPAGLGNLPNLDVLDVSDTSLGGAMPNEVCALSSGLGLFQLCADCTEVLCCCCTCCTSPFCPA